MLHAGQSDRGMHEIGNRNRACVDVLAFLVQHGSEVAIDGSLLVSLEILRAALQIDVAQSDDVFGARGIVQVNAALSTAADGRNIQFVVKRLISQSPERRYAAESGCRNRAGQQRAKEEMPPGNVA